LRALWDAVRARLEQAGLDSRGRVRIPELTASERLSLQSLIDRAPSKTLDLGSLELHLGRLGLGEDLADALAALGHPVSREPAARRAESAERRRAHALARERVKQWPEDWAEAWIDAVIQAGVLRGYDREQAGGLLEQVRRVLDALPSAEGDARSLVELAAQVLGSSHALDAGTRLGSAVERALRFRAASRPTRSNAGASVPSASNASASDASVSSASAFHFSVSRLTASNAAAASPSQSHPLASEALTSDALAATASPVHGGAYTDPEHALEHGEAACGPAAGDTLRAIRSLEGQRRRELWERAGVRLDLTSAPVLTWCLPVPEASPLGPLMRASSTAEIPLHLSRFALTRHPLEVAPGTRILVVENPRVVEAAAELGTRRPLLCTNGQPSSTVLLALEQLVSAGARLYYHGDFDSPGLSICERMMRLGLIPWRMAREDYAHALAVADRDGIELPIDMHAPGATPWDASLQITFDKERRIVHEERLLPGLLEAELE